MTRLTPSIDRVKFPPWGEREINRFKFRVGLFTQRGMAEPLAETLADRLFERDFERDDRHLCIECTHRRSETRCVKKWPVLDDVLQRCPHFTFEVPKA